MKVAVKITRQFPIGFLVAGSSICPMSIQHMLPESDLLLHEFVVHLFRPLEFPLLLEQLDEIVFPFGAQLSGYQYHILVKSTLNTHDLFDCPISAVQRAQNPAKQLRQNADNIAMEI